MPMYSISPGGGAGSEGGGSGSSGGEYDVTDGVMEADPLASGGVRRQEQTVNGIPWLLSYDDAGNVIERAWAAGGLVVTIDHTDPVTGPVASGNITTDQGIRVVSSQMAALKAALIALGLSGVSPRFFVADYAGGLSVEWSPAFQCFRGFGGSELFVHCNNTPVVGADGPGTTETTLFTAVIPGWLRSSYMSARGEYDMQITQSVAENKRFRMKLNGTIWHDYTTSATNQVTVLGDAEFRQIDATGFRYPAVTGNLSSGTQISSSGSWAAQTVTEGADLTLTMTAQFVTTGGAGNSWYARRFALYVRNP